MNKKILMNLLKQKRGIVGIEAAIVLIAFIVIAAALAYVVINMGFYSSQKAKSTIDAGVKEASSALCLDGFVVGLASSGNMSGLAIPLKLAVGQEAVDLAQNSTVIAVYGTGWGLSNIYSGTQSSTETDLETLISSVNNTLASNATGLILFGDGDTVLEQHEKAYALVHFDSAHQIQSYTELKVEIRTNVGAALTVERDIPGGLPNSGICDLG
ncbi:MAG TPA: archaellin/type IV pilin N-terminal domain-containing protein [Candidatus Bathyarchaeia archaeon]